MVSGCAYGGDNYDSLVPDDMDRLSRNYLALIERGQVDSAELMLPAAIHHDSARYHLRILADSLAGTPLDSAAVIGLSLNTQSVEGADQTKGWLTYLVPMRGRWMMVTISSNRVAQDQQITGFNYQVLAKDPRVEQLFTWEGKGVAHHLWLLLGGACLLGSVCSALWVAGQRGFPRRWLWAFVALIGVGSSSVDWTSGATGFKTFHWLLFCFAATKAGPAAPWVFTFAFPAGAFLAVSKVLKWRSDQQKVTEVTPEPPPSSLDTVGLPSGTH
jgi:hypothetical protein